jgi:hypothetical protein
VTATETDQLAERIHRVHGRVSHIVALASIDLMRANEGAYAALGNLLAEHAPTALVRRAEPCDAHRYTGIGARRDCPDCVMTERAGCQRCRDEYGDPARPEDCEVRKIIGLCLTRTIDEASIDAATAT